MLSLRKIAVTGTLSSGKSSVCRILQRLGAYILSADEIVHQLLNPETEVGKRVIALLGPDVVVNGAIHRSRITEKIANNQTLFTSLENLLHPEVLQRIESEYVRVAKEAQCGLFVVEIPLLLEKGWAKDYDCVLCVVADEDTCFMRYQQATHRSRRDFDLFRSRQLSSEEKARQADYVIYNNGSYEELEQNVSRIFPNLYLGNNFFTEKE